MSDEIAKLKQENTELKNKITFLTLDLKKCKIDLQEQKFDSKQKISALTDEIRSYKGHHAHESFIDRMAEKKLQEEQQAKIEQEKLDE